MLGFILNGTCLYSYMYTKYIPALPKRTFEVFSECSSFLKINNPFRCYPYYWSRKYSSQGLQGYLNPLQPVPLILQQVFLIHFPKASNSPMIQNTILLTHFPENHFYPLVLFDMILAVQIGYFYWDLFCGYGVFKWLNSFF